MAATASPYGLRPVQLLGGLPYAGAIRTFPLNANSARGFFFGDPVGISAGQLTALTASPVPTVDANSPIGIFMGAEWQDPIRGFVNSQFFPAAGITAGATKVKFKILEAPDVVFRVQHTGSVAAASLGMNVALTVASLTLGSTVTGDSLVTVTGTPAITATLACKIVGFVDAPGSAVGDAFTDLLCIWNATIHRWRAAAAL